MYSSIGSGYGRVRERQGRPAIHPRQTASQDLRHNTSKKPANFLEVPGALSSPLYSGSELPGSRI